MGTRVWIQYIRVWYEICVHVVHNSYSYSKVSVWKFICLPSHNSHHPPLLFLPYIKNYLNSLLLIHFYNNAHCSYIGNFYIYLVHNLNYAITHNSLLVWTVWKMVSINSDGYQVISTPTGSE